ncbi:hypothetical protein ACFWWT_34530 [Streptomyces sp. NPDC058676]|uniref:hypothetical protein n=1 Tax=unclassified Streptomyces TaxID=2593676 RepID=UPI0036573496
MRGDSGSPSGPGEAPIRPARGATGFRDRRDGPLPATDPKLFRAACFEAARGVRGRADVLTIPGPSTFEAATITGRGEPCTVVCHTHLPLVAFTDTPPEPGRPLSRFVDPPPWADAFGAVGLRALRVTELSTPMSTVDVEELSAGELEQVRYWRPDALSDLLFNWWD